MGKIANERHVHFHYAQIFIEHYREQTPALKQLCHDIGQPYGYSAMNVFYVFFFQYHAHRTGGKIRYPFRHSL